MTTVPPDPDVRRTQLLSLALDYATAQDHGGIERAVTEGRRLGVDLTGDPAAMAAVSVLADCLRMGMEPSKRALAILGCGEAA